MRSNGYAFPTRRGTRAGLCAVVVLVCALAAIGSLAPVATAGDSGYRGRRVIDVLREFQDRGLDLVFSSAVVGEDLRVNVEPAATEPRAVLEEILLPLGLQAKDGPGTSILILRATPDTGKLIGRVISATGKRPIAGASVRLAHTVHGATTGSDGSFEVREIPAGRYRVIVEATGFVTATFPRVRVAAKDDVELTVHLTAHPAFVTEVVVTPSRHSVVRPEQVSSHSMASEETVLVPSVGGDISRVIELLPGVAAVDNSAAFNVRGSLDRDTSLILDGLELYDPFHLQGFHSPFNLIDTSVVDRIDFFGGGFTADLGDRHGGFVEISTFVPEESPGTEIALGTLNSRVSHRSPLPAGSGSWLLSARGWYPEAVLDTTKLGGGENLNPRFGDVYVKAAFNRGSRHRLSSHGLFAYDRLHFRESGEEVNESVDARTRNAFVWLRALSAWTANLSSETILSGGRIEREREGVAAVDGPVIVDDTREVYFFGLKHDATWRISKAHALKVGADVRWLHADYLYSNVITEDPQSSRSLRLGPDGTSAGIYASHQTRISSEIAAELGVRWDRQTYTNDNQLSPRFNAAWRPSERSELRLALGRYNQSQRIHELHVEDGETQFRRAEVAEQAEMSFRHALAPGLGIRIDAYYKKLSRLRPRYENLFEAIELFPETMQDRVLVAPEEARLQGVELLVRGDIKRPFFWWVSYTLSSADDVVDGGYVPRSWDQTHAGKFLLAYRRDDRWSVALTGSARTGWPTTPVEAELVTLPDGSTEIEEVLCERNSDRYSTYLRLDLKARRSFSVPRGRLSVELEVVNLTDRDNACCVDEFVFEPQPDDTVDVRRRLDYWLGISPSFAVLWEF